jgi:hypothetical protein
MCLDIETFPTTMGASVIYYALEPVNLQSPQIWLFGGLKAMTFRTRRAAGEINF